jgi:hypothetical protein
MNKPGRTVDILNRQIAEQQKRQEQVRAELEGLKNRVKVLDRKLDTRRKIVAGGFLLAQVKVDSAFHAEVQKRFQAANTRPQDRSVLPEFFAESPPAPVPPARPSKLPGEPPSGAAPR